MFQELLAASCGHPMVNVVEHFIDWTLCVLRWCLWS